MFINVYAFAQPKGNLVHIPEPDCGTVSDPRISHGNVTRLGDAHWSSGKSYLFYMSHRGPGILLQGEWVLVLAKSAAVLAASAHVRRDLENPGEVTVIRTSSYPYPQQVSKVNSLWSIE